MHNWFETFCCPAVLHHAEMVTVTDDVQCGFGNGTGDIHASILPKSVSAEEEREKSLVRQNLDIAQALPDHGDDKYEGIVDSAQSDGMEAEALIIDLDTWEIASEQNPGAGPTPFSLEKAAVKRATSFSDIGLESVREATEKVIDAATDDVKQIPYLACLTSDDDHTHVLNSFTTCSTISSTKEEQSGLSQKIVVDATAESMNSQILDGVWVLHIDDPMAVVKGSGVKLPRAIVNGTDVMLMGDGAPERSFQLQELGAGVWASNIDDDELLVDCQEREDGRLLLHWSNGLTWVRKQKGTEIDSVSGISSSSPSCSSSSSSSSSEFTLTTCSSFRPAEAGKISEAPEVIIVGEVAELVAAADTSKARKNIDVDDYED